MDKVFRTPTEISKAKTQVKTPVSARIPQDVHERLEKAAAKSNVSLSLLIAEILEDYDRWLASKK